MKTQVIKTERIAGDAYYQSATVLTLNQAPTLEEQKRLFYNDSVVLEF